MFRGRYSEIRKNRGERCLRPTNTVNIKHSLHQGEAKLCLSSSKINTKEGLVTGDASVVRLLRSLTFHTPVK